MDEPVETIPAADRQDGRGAAPAASAGASPVLYLRGVEGGRVTLSAQVVQPSGAPAPVLRTECGRADGREIWSCNGLRVLHYAFALPLSRHAWYAFGDSRFPVDTAFAGDLRIAYVSCNGQEHGDRGRTLDERNVMWQRLADQHRERPFQLLLHGGDQLYADETCHAHPALRSWAGGKPKAAADCAPAALEEVRTALRRDFFRRYAEVLTQPAIAWLAARVPSLAMWDDHDICDGWGSMRPERLDAPLGRCLFDVAREHFLMFQCGADPDRVPATFLDPTGTSLGWHVRLPQLDVIAPDLRSERRPERVMGECGWQALDRALGAVGSGRVLLLSSVPALGPRLSWVEAIMHLTPHAEKYEDDLRDQWQSRAHRAEWRRFLESLAAVHQRGDAPVTVLSGEIHLATWGTLDVPPRPLHQLVASGIAHPAPPRAYAMALGALARFGESPLPGHSVRLHPLPGQKTIYTAQRNYLVLERQDGAWRAWWELEDDGATPPLQI